MLEGANGMHPSHVSTEVLVLPPSPPPTSPIVVEKKARKPRVKKAVVETPVLIILDGVAEPTPKKVRKPYTKKAVVAEIV